MDVQVALDVLPFDTHALPAGLDLGAGTGYFSAQFLHRFPKSRVVAVDGADTMLDAARERLAPFEGRVDLRLGDLRKLDQCGFGRGAFDIAFSSFALHHMNAREKEHLIRTIVSILRPGGCFVNADIVVAESGDIEAKFQELRVEGSSAARRSGVARNGPPSRRAVPRRR